MAHIHVWLIMSHPSISLFTRATELWWNFRWAEHFYAVGQRNTENSREKNLKKKVSSDVSTDEAVYQPTDISGLYHRCIDLVVIMWSV